MSLITNRPTHWNAVIGQERVQRVLTGVLDNPQYMTRGFIFSGVRGIGKTTIAYLFAKALMCQSGKPLHCKDCPSCKEFDVDAGQHADFTEVDAASHSGVDQARQFVELSGQQAQFARRRVILVDEAHRLSDAAWDVYLKPLELADTHTVFLFSTSEPQHIPATIRSRCTSLPFALVTRDSILGHLMSIADREKLPYTLDGLRRVADLAQGSPREAINLFQTVAVTGPVTIENCQAVLVEDLSANAERIFDLLIRSSKVSAEQSKPLVIEALQCADQAAQVSGPATLIAAMFSSFAQGLFQGSEVAKAFSNYKAVTSTFLRWSQSQQLPVDAISLVIMELSEHLPGQIPVLLEPEQRQAIGMHVRKPSRLIQEDTPTAPQNKTLSVEELSQLIGANV